MIQIPIKKIRELLVGPGHIREVDFDAAAKEAAEKNISLESILVNEGLISDKELGRTIADGFNYHFVDLKQIKVTRDFLNIIPEVVARSQQAIIFEQDGDILKLATSNPNNYEFIKLLEKKTGRSIKIYYATPLGIKEAIKFYKSDLGVRVQGFIKDLEANPKNQENIVKLVNVFLEYAYDNRASDVHIEPLGEEVSVRFRIDGVLHEIIRYPMRLHDKIVFRLKIMARLRTDEHAAAQDGRFDYDMESSSFDVRLSILPITDGENIVMRILAERSRRLTLEELGLRGTDLKKMKEAALKPYGMILAVGPTGSGKTTTLYSILQILNRPEVNIMTIEDPVEYDMEHIQQTQVNSNKRLTFATGLRSIVRQDPDIIMVGEIRDKETAAIAVNAAMTGHLLLSTLHANDAATTFPRLMDMGIEPYLVASSVNVVVAQRLIRNICAHCRASYVLSKEEIGALKINSQFVDLLKAANPNKNLSKLTFFKGTGCKRCNQTGYRGRTGIFEVMEVTEEFRTLIVQQSAASVINNKARKLGMTSMLQDGIVKIMQGLTTIEEVMRATRI